jgi:uncharacterized lipoprotein YajG
MGGLCFTGALLIGIACVAGCQTPHQMAPATPQFAAATKDDAVAACAYVASRDTSDIRGNEQIRTESPAAGW